jgi:hypothetical protein
MSYAIRDAPGSLKPSITQRDIELEVAQCVGGVASPILSNIYLHRLDTFVETVLIPEYTRGKRRAFNPAYRRAQYRVRQARQHGDRDEARALGKHLRGLPSQDPDDPDYRRLRYVRYADDCVPRTLKEASM